MSSEAPAGEPYDNADQDYRSLSGLAILGLVLGLASPAYFGGPLLVVIPLAALAVSAAALRRIRANPDVFTGSLAAQVGAVLAVLCLSAVFSRGQFEKMLLSRQAAEVSKPWVELVREGRIGEAHRLTQSSQPPRPRPPRPGDRPERSPDELVAEYAAAAPVKALTKLGPGESKLEGVAELQRLGRGRIRLSHDYALHDSQGRVGQATVVLERSAPSPQRDAQWRVVDAAVSLARR